MHFSFFLCSVIDSAAKPVQYKIQTIRNFIFLPFLRYVLLCRRVESFDCNIHDINISSYTICTQRERETKLISIYDNMISKSSNRNPWCNWQSNHSCWLIERQRDMQKADRRNSMKIRKFTAILVFFFLSFSFLFRCLVVIFFSQIDWVQFATLFFHFA